MKSDLDKQSFLNCAHQEPHTMETLLLTTQPTNPCSSWSHKHDEQYEPWPKLSIHRFGTLEFIKGTIHIFLNTGARHQEFKSVLRRCKLRRIKLST